MFQCCITEENGEKVIRLDRGMNGYLIGTLEPTLEQLKEHSQLYHVTENTPPAYLWTTWNDEMVPPENSLLYAPALIAKGVKAEVHMFVNGPHGLSLADHTCSVGEGYVNEAV